MAEKSGMEIVEQFLSLIKVREVKFMGVCIKKMKLNIRGNIQ